MQIICPTLSGLLYRNFQYKNRHYLTVSIPLMCCFQNEQLSLVDAQGLWNVFSEQSVEQFDNDVLDYILPKAEPEVIINGYAYGRYAAKDNQTLVSFSLNNVQKALRVWGDRYWVGNDISAAQAFDKIAISHYNAFGGADVPKNLIGKGRDFIEINGELFKPVANVESLGEPICDPRKFYEPMGFSALRIDDSERLHLMGTYDEDWVKTGFPGFAKDIDWRFFNLSPQDQRLNELKAGDVASFMHMHPTKSKLEIKIPDLCARVFLNTTERSETLQSVETKLTTAWFYPHLERAIFIYQATIETSSDDNFSGLMVAVERDGKNKTLEYYQKIFHLRTSEHAVDYALVDSQLIDSSLIKKQDLQLTDPFLDKMLYGLEKSLAEMESDIQEKDASLNTFLAKKNVDFDNSDSTFDTPEDELFDIEDFSSEEQVNAYVKQQNNGFLNLLNEMRQQKIVKKELAEVLNQTTPDLIDLSEEKVQLIDKSHKTFLTGLRELEEKRAIMSVTTSPKATFDPQLRELIKKDDLNWQAFFSDENPEDSINRDLLGTHDLESLFNCPERDEDTKIILFIQNKQFFDENYSSLEIYRLRLESITFNHCDFSDGLFYATRFVNCTFNYCRFNDAVFERSRFESCQFESCEFNNFDNDKMYVNNTSFINCQIGVLIHNRLTLELTNFEKCEFSGTDFLGLKARQLTISDSQLEQVLFDRVFFDELSFLGCRGESIALLLDKPSQKLSFRQCQLASFLLGEGGVVSGLEINDSRIEKSTLSNTYLEQLLMSDSSFSNSDFEKSYLNSGKLEKCHFDEAVFVGTYFNNVLCDSLDCHEADFQASKFEGSVFKNVSFYAANLALIQTDDATVFADDCFYAKANFYPRLDHD